VPFTDSKANYAKPDGITWSHDVRAVTTA